MNNYSNCSNKKQHSHGEKCEKDKCEKDKCEKDKCEKDKCEKYGKSIQSAKLDFIKVVNQGTQTIGSGCPLVFNELSIMRGNTMRFRPPSANITLAGGAAYYITYKVQAFNPTATQGTTSIATRLFLDENPISGTLAQEVIQFNERGNLVAFAIIATPYGACNNLQLRNVSPEMRNFFDANITIMRIA